MIKGACPDAYSKWSISFQTATIIGGLSYKY
jgi:hypothetical protein